MSTIAQVEHGQLHLEAEGIGTVLVLVAAAGVTHYGSVVGTDGRRGTGTRGGAGAGTWHGGIRREEGRHLLELNIWEKGEEETRPHTINQERGVKRASKDIINDRAVPLFIPHAPPLLPLNGGGKLYSAVIRIVV